MAGIVSLYNRDGGQGGKQKKVKRLEDRKRRVESEKGPASIEKDYCLSFAKRTYERAHTFQMARERAMRQSRQRRKAVSIRASTQR